MPIALYLLTRLPGAPSVVTSPIVASPFKLLAPDGSPDGITSTQARKPVNPGTTGGTRPGSRPVSLSLGFTPRPLPTDQCVGCWRVKTKSKSVICQIGAPPTS